MADVRIDDHSIQEPTVAHQHPTKTTPQGTQEYGVLNGHEHRDINIGALLRWFGGLAVSVMVVILLMWGTYKLFDYRENLAQPEMMPSPLFKEVKDLQPEMKPEPRLLPNPAQPEPKGPGDYAGQEKEAEVKRLWSYGLAGPHGEGTLPSNAVRFIPAAENPAPVGAKAGPGDNTKVPPGDQTLDQYLPADSSGGRTWDGSQK